MYHHHLVPAAKRMKLIKFSKPKRIFERCECKELGAEHSYSAPSTPINPVSYAQHHCRKVLKWLYTYICIDIYIFSGVSGFSVFDRQKMSLVLDFTDQNTLYIKKIKLPFFIAGRLAG